MNSPTISGSTTYRIELGAADVAELGLRIPPGTSQQVWLTIGRRLAKQHLNLPWRIGDWAFYGEGEYSKSYDEMCEVTGLEYQTLRNYAWVAGRFIVSRRRDNVSFSHHMEVASLGSDVEQDKWLDKAVQEGWSSKELRKALSEGLAGGGPSTNEPPAETSIKDQNLGPSENAFLASTLEALRMTIDIDDAREISARADLEGISASAWLRRLLDEVLPWQ
jgi:hypothetical protein